ncbi:DUF4179 domain-containing protein [Clostridium oryzae]|uniref:DUF4179 domain-containing protein n=1 Tax=Clostridium oryzae TaxID=1450648 RepID=A0A1V4IN93_9CLOT|nr:DUF4179 domain-containing protein [Clostridium oryzae]OPJ61319.1 hypothetical protein CLORY_23590 [Clostridium oryzae]
MNSHDYRDAMRGIKPSKELNDRIVFNILDSDEDKRIFRNRSRKKKLVLICAIILSLSSISVAAATWNIADVFKGYFKEHISSTKDNKQADIKNNSVFLKTAGAIIKSTDTEAGLKLTARGVVGDDRMLNVAIDVRTVNGKSFTDNQEDKLNSINFEEVELQVDDDVSRQYCSCTRIDDGSKKGKATFMIHTIVNSNIKKLSGHNITILLTNFLHTTNKLDDIGMKGSLYNIFTKFDKANDKDYRYYSVRSDSNHFDKDNKILKEYYSMRESGKLTGDKFLKRREELIKAGLLEPLYTLPKTSKKITFSEKYPKLEITNMGIKDNIFTFNMNINDELDYQYLFNKPLALVNRKTGKCVRTTMDIDEGDTKKLTSAHFVVFHTITSAEQLKDYYLAIGGEGTQDIINKGIWKLKFKLSYKDTSRRYNINKKAKISGFAGRIKSIDISPLSMKIIYKTDKLMNTENKAYFEDNWKGNIYLVLKDGSKIAELSCEEDYKNGVFMFKTMFNATVSLEQIKKIVIDGTEIIL